MLWIIGDEFVDRTFTQSYKHVKIDENTCPYAFEKFEVIDFAATRYSSSLRNVPACFLSLVTVALWVNKPNVEWID